MKPLMQIDTKRGAVWFKSRLFLGIADYGWIDNQRSLELAYNYVIEREKTEAQHKHALFSDDLSYAEIEALKAQKDGIYFNIYVYNKAENGIRWHGFPSVSRKKSNANKDDFAYRIRVKPKINTKKLAKETIQAQSKARWAAGEAQLSLATNKW